jgi:hypothetical protein
MAASHHRRRVSLALALAAIGGLLVCWPLAVAVSLG